MRCVPAKPRLRRKKIGASGACPESFDKQGGERSRTAQDSEFIELLVELLAELLVELRSRRISPRGSTLIRAEIVMLFGMNQAKEDFYFKR